MGHETHLLFHRPSMTCIELVHGVHGAVLQEILDERGWRLCDVSILDNRWDEMQEDLEQLGIETTEAMEELFAGGNHLQVCDVLPGVRDGRDLEGLAAYLKERPERGCKRRRRSSWSARCSGCRC